MYLLHKRLKHVKLKLKEWNKKDFGNTFVNKKSVEIKLQELNQAMIIDGFDRVKSEQADKYNQEWENLCKQEETFGDKSLEFSGSKKVNETPNFSRNLPWPIERTIESLQF